MTIQLITALFTSFLFGCALSQDQRMEHELELMRAEELAKIDRQACAADGGSIEYVGLLGTPACVRPYKDAGNSCTDSAQCLGMCMAQKYVPAGQPVAGFCQRNDSNFGCYSEVIDGNATQAMCVD